MVSHKALPILDFANLKTDRETFSKNVFEASKEWGFFILTGTNLENVDRMFDLVGSHILCL